MYKAANDLGCGKDCCYAGFIGTEAPNTSDDCEKSVSTGRIYRAGFEGQRT